MYMPPPYDGNNNSQRMVDERDMTIEEHLSSLPDPPPGPESSSSGWQQAAPPPGYRNPMDSYSPQMLGGVLPNKTGAGGGLIFQPPKPGGNHQPVIVSRAEGTSSEASPSSCSPSSVHGTLAARRHTSSPVDVTSVLAHQMKIEPLDTGYPGLIHHPSASHMAMNLGYGGGPPRRSASGDCPSSSSSQPASTASSRRTSRASHDGMLKCHFCPKKWSDEATLQMHMVDCRVIRSHECGQCGKRFKARGGLQQHARIHSNDRPYECRFCAKKFTQKSHVDQHERIHTGAKPFVCQFCGRAFRQRSQQMGHEATHASSSAASASSSSHVTHGVHQQPPPTQVRVEPQRPQETMPSSSAMPGDLSGLLGLSPNCANSAVTSLLALSQNTPFQTPHDVQHLINGIQ